MASWWMPVPQLLVLRRIAAGEKLLRDALDNTYRWAGSKEKCTPTGRALQNKGLIFDYGARSPGWEAEMHITPTAKNELEYNRNREID
ncbi:hypothetical protein [Kluyvera ascorbata]|uniref:hypothetical protein n=1 Tax=Kluyvera ascorbata TaxID=51288 RepID=UPI00205A75E0|nr:hypothetical protein [Kluyvera ascorbata]UPQ73480.1 hypothetical protein MY052_09530 [Kluyvera ascorbata]